MSAGAARLQGLPEPLPAGETILWQGRPCWRALALRAFHVRKVAIYFAALMVWRGADTLIHSGSAARAAISAAWMMLPALIAVGVLSLLAWLYARSTLYTITSRRVVMQFGVALPMTFNIPFRLIGAAAFRTYPDGSGDIPLSTTGDDRIAYLLLWPNVRPWRFGRAEPMLRAVADVARAAEVLTEAVRAATPAQGPADPVVGRSGTTAAVEVAAA